MSSRHPPSAPATAPTRRPRSLPARGTPRRAPPQPLLWSFRLRSRSLAHKNRGTGPIEAMIRMESIHAVNDVRKILLIPFRVNRFMGSCGKSRLGPSDLPSFFPHFPLDKIYKMVYTVFCWTSLVLLRGHPKPPIRRLYCF